MRFKSSTQPLCRYCGEPIKKTSKRIHIRREMGKFDIANGNDYVGYVYIGEKEWPRSKEECQRLVNETVLSVQYEQHSYENSSVQRKAGDVDSFTTWDGETYDHEFFCNGPHARAFANVIAKQTTYAMKPYHDAMKAREKETQNA